MLTDHACRNAKCPDSKAHLRYADSGGLYLQVTPISKRWFWKYRFAGEGKAARAWTLSEDWTESRTPAMERSASATRQGY